MAAKLLALCGLAALVLAASASADRELVRHRLAIGKVRLGMSVRDVRRLLGPPRSTTRELRGRNVYVEPHVHGVALQPADADRRVQVRDPLFYAGWKVRSEPE